MLVTSRNSGRASTLDKYLDRLFDRQTVGVTLTVDRIDMRDEQIVAILSARRLTTDDPLLDLPLPSPRPSGAEWIEGYVCGWPEWSHNSRSASVESTVPRAPSPPQRFVAARGRGFLTLRRPALVLIAVGFTTLKYSASSHTLYTSDVYEYL